MRSTRFVMALCAISVFAAACQKANQGTDVTVINKIFTGPSALTECNDGVDNADPEDDLADTADPDCHTDGNAGNQGSYNPLDPSERNGGGEPVVTGRPGDFNLFGTCVGSRARLSWTSADRADGYFIERRLWTSGAWVRLSKFYSVSERTNVEVDADVGSANYWRVVAVNAAGEAFSRSPEERDDKTATFACGPPATSTPPPTSGADPGPGPGPGPSNPGPGPGNPPPSGGTCSGASASLPDLTAKSQTRGFQINIPSGCAWLLDSNNHHVVSVNPASGNGPASGSVTALNSGTATIRFVVGGVAVSQRTYVIP